MTILKLIVLGSNDNPLTSLISTCANKRPIYLLQTFSSKSLLLPQIYLHTKASQIQ